MVQISESSVQTQGERTETLISWSLNPICFEMPKKLHFLLLQNSKKSC